MTRSRFYSLCASFFFCFGLFADVAQPHHQTAFIGCPGQLDFLPSYSFYSCHAFWNKHGRKLPSFNHFKQHTYQTYLEYALQQRLSLTLNAHYSRVKETMQKCNRGFEDTAISVKWLLLRGETSAFTTQLALIIPSGITKPSIRYGKWGLQAGLLFSKGFIFANKSAWIDSGLSYRIYKGFPANQIQSFFSFGYQLLHSLQLISTIELEYGLRSSKAKYWRNNIAWDPSYRLLKGQMEILIHLHSSIKATLGGFKHLLGRNVGTGGGFFGGIWITL